MQKTKSQRVAHPAAYSNALGRKFLKLEEFLNPTPASASESSQPAEAKSQARESAAAAKPEAPSLLRKLFS